MFKYSPKKTILREIDVPKTGRWWDKSFTKRLEVLRKYGIRDAHDLYIMGVLLETHYRNVCFYSKDPLRKVPVNGILFPSAMFSEEIT